MQPSAATAHASSLPRCNRCNTELGATQDRVQTTEGILCPPCANNLQAERTRDIQAQGQDVNYPMALLGALLGGTLGVLAWWLITVWTNTAFGLVAILIGIAVGKGTTMLAGNKRSRGLQILSLIVAGSAFFYASFLVNRSFIQQALEKEGREMALAILPNPATMAQVVALNFDVMSVLFLAITLWEAWKIPGPAKLP
ncbi:MAG TPA: hypothetical protein VGR67_06995 [Candidatus Polarisedimenticolia bacterium]|jgi:hypothetical protein|nr:hypothetical protein [Candidatus Polarisedimenticolia bacterium]